MNKAIPKILRRQQEKITELQQRKGSVPIINQASLHLYSPRVEASINHYFSVTEKRQLDPHKVKLVMDDIKAEAKQYFNSTRKSPSKHRSDPFIKDPVVR